MAMVAIAAFTFSGCSNEDIQIDKSLTIKVSPSGVVAPFTYEVNKGVLAVGKVWRCLQVSRVAFEALCL